MMHTNRLSSTLGSLVSLLALVAGCSTRAVVGTDSDPVDSSDCSGACPGAVYAEGLHAGYSEILDLAVTSDGGAVIAGTFMGELTIGGTTLHATNDNQDGFIVKLDASGSAVWARHVTGAPGSIAVAVRPTGEIWVAGSFQGSIDLGAGKLTSEGAFSLFVAELLADGSPGNAHVYDGDAWVTDLALASNGDLVITGAVSGPTSFGSIVIAPEDTSEGAQSGYVARIAPSGDVQWANRYGLTLGDISALADGTLAIVGGYKGSATFGTASLPAEGTPSNAFIGALDASGAPLWGSRLDPTPSIAGDAIAANGAKLTVTPDGKLVVAFHSMSGDDGSELFNQGIHVQTFEPTGARASHADLGSGGLDTLALAVAPDGDIVVGGGFFGVLSLGSASLEGPGVRTAFLARFAPADATLRWAKQFLTLEARQEMVDVVGATEPTQTVIHMGVAPDGRPLVAGEYEGTFTLDDASLPASPDNPNAFVAAFEP